MGRLILRRLLLAIPTLLLVSVGVFALSLGNGADRAALARAGGGDLADLDAIAKARAELRLDDPVIVRYVGWLGDAVRLDFGRSYVNMEPVQTSSGIERQAQAVWPAIKSTMPRTLALVGVALVISSFLGVFVGIIAGSRPGGLLDRLLMSGATVGLAVPNFLVGMLLVSLFAVNLDWLPAFGYKPISDAGYFEWFKHLVLPAFAMSLAPAATIARQMRAALADVLGSPFIRTAWAKGAGFNRIVFGHALRNAASAPLTVFGLVAVQLLSGTVILETIFGIQGIGSLIVSAVQSGDVPTMQAVVFTLVLINVGVNLMIDILYGVLNPKVRMS